MMRPYVIYILVCATPPGYCSPHCSADANCKQDIEFAYVKTICIALISMNAKICGERAMHSKAVDIMRHAYGNVLLELSVRARFQFGRALEVNTNLSHSKRRTLCNLHEDSERILSFIEKV